MQLDFAFIAQAADVNDGRLHVFGGSVDKIEAAAIPAAGPPLTLVVRVRVLPVDVDTPHTIAIVIENPLGQSKNVIEKPITTRLNPIDPAEESGALFVVHMGIVFEHVGTYRIKVLLDGKVVRSLPLFIVLTDHETASSAPAMAKAEG